MNYPDVIILGFPKCGTTALGSYLQCYPGVHVQLKEMNYFNDENFGKIPYEWDSRYFNVDKSPTLIYSQKNLKRIAETCPNIQIILCLRNPTDRFFSDYYFSKQKMGLPDLSDLTHPQIVRLLRQGVYYDWIVLTWGILGNGQLAQEKIHFIAQEELYKEPNTVVNNLMAKFGFSPIKLWHRTVNKSLPYTIDPYDRARVDEYYEKMKHNQRVKRITGIDYCQN